MAYPSQTLDGNPDWFANGQSIFDPGLERIPFGIPVNCDNTPDICGPLTINHYTWGIQPVGSGGTVGVTAKISDVIARWESTLPGIVHIDIECVQLFPPYSYNGPLVTIETVFGFDYYYLIEVLDGGTTYSFGATPTTPPADWFIRMHYLPGP